MKNIKSYMYAVQKMAHGNFFVFGGVYPTCTLIHGPLILAWLLFEFLAGLSTLVWVLLLKCL